MFHEQKTIKGEQKIESMEIEKIHTSTALLSGFCILVIDVPSAAALTTAVITPPESNK